MTLNENQKEMYKNCIFLNESLTKKKETIPATYYTTIAQLSSALSTKILQIKTIKSVNANKDDHNLIITLKYPTDKFRFENAKDEKIWSDSIKDIDKVLGSLKKLVRDKTELHDTVSNYYLDFSEFIVKISFYHEDDNFQIKFKYVK